VLQPNQQKPPVHAGGYVKHGSSFGFINAAKRNLTAFAIITDTAGISHMSEINPYKLKISQLRALVAVANHGNFSEAALHLELSQSAVSHAIASLEEELGVMLLSRGRHGAHLTPDSTSVSMVMQGLGAAFLPRLAAEPYQQEFKCIVYQCP
jgi:DNA-binding transcriptional ArsR family regulator